MKAGTELYKRILSSSVRGHVKKSLGKELDVVWEFNGEKIITKENVENLGKEFFLTEGELIQKEGKHLLTLAPPIETNLKKTTDFYGFELNVDDFVIAMAGEPLYNKIEGFVKRIYKSSARGSEGITFIDIVKDGITVLERTNARLFSLPERFN